MSNRRSQRLVTTGITLHPYSQSIRKNCIRAYHTQLQSLAVATEKLRVYAEQDQPAFTLWWQLEFTEVWARLKSRERQLHDLQLLVDAVELYRLHSHTAPAKAFATVAKAQAEGTLKNLIESILQEKRSAAHQTQHQPMDSTQASAPPTRRRIKATASAQDTQDHFAPGPSPVQMPALTPEQTTEQYLKKMYRELVRILHPDGQGHGEPSKAYKMLWHDLQNAYRQQNIAGMEAIFKSLHGPAAEAIDLHSIPIGDIVAMKQEIAQRLALKRHELKSSRKQANWDFCQKRQQRDFLAKLAASISVELAAEIRAIDRCVDQLQERIRVWQKKPEKQASLRRSRQD